MSQIKNIKQLSVAELQVKIAEAKAGYEALSASGNPYAEQCKADMEAYQAELGTRKSAVFIEKLSKPVAAAVEKAFKGEQIDGDVVIQLRVTFNAEGQITTGILEEKARKASAGSGTPRQGGGGAGKQPCKVVTLDNQEFESDSAADALRKLKELKIVAEDTGNKDSANRVLKALANRGNIKSYELLPKVEKTDATPVANENEVAPAPVVEGTPPAQ